ncbi:hypothetical protein [Candidatus Protofrankia californiensis]|uniref:hypothetical protein n=1 Tax=Candidatus Protofrankia californiensis TaxID=1839754 RepID=UPI0010416B65|nr:hypothetical protein [Candidatus Protofrankia californiensis]
MICGQAASPRSGALTGWGNAWLAGLVSTDEAITEILEGSGGPGAPHTIDGEGLALGLGRLRTVGARRLRLVLPVPGDVSGLPGPAETNQEALAAGEAVVVLGPVPPLLLVPSVTAHGPAVEGGLESVHWRSATGHRVPPPPSPLSAAEHELNDAIRTATAALLHLDRAKVDPDALAALRERHADEPTLLLPPGYPPSAHALLARAGRIASLIDLAARDDGAAVTAEEIERRSTTLRGLSAAVRRACESAYDAFDPSQSLAR